MGYGCQWVCLSPRRPQKNVKETLLEASVQPTELSALNRAPYQGFIHPKTEVFRNRGFGLSFLVDDPKLYEEFLRTAREIHAKWGKVPIRDIMPSAIQYTIGRYFGNFEADANTEAANRQFYMERCFADTPPVSLAEVRGKGFAVCAEKAAAAQNLLSMIGLKSELYYSLKCKLSDAENEDAHAYNVVSTENGHFIFDPTNPVTVQHDQSKTYQPTLYRITPEELARLRGGGGCWRLPSFVSLIRSSLRLLAGSADSRRGGASLQMMGEPGSTPVPSSSSYGSC